MRTADFEDILNGALALAGITPSTLLTADFVSFRSWANSHLRVASEQIEFPDQVRVEQRWFRADYASGTAYTNNGTIIYFPQTRLYYQALKATTGNPPANSLDVLDTSRWALAQTEYSGPNYSSTGAYVAGDIVFYPTNNLYYACHTASTGNAPTNTTYWGVLTVFDRYVAYAQTSLTALGETLEVFEQSPLIYFNATPLRGGVDWKLSQNGVQVLVNLPWVWLRYRVRNTNLKGNAYSATTAYTAGQQIYYSSASTPGNFYDCVTTTTAGQSPDTTAAKWSVVSIPYVAQPYLEQALYSEWLVADGQTDRAAWEMKKAKEILGDSMMLLTGQQQQQPRMTVMTR